MSFDRGSSSSPPPPPFYSIPSSPSTCFSSLLFLFLSPCSSSSLSTSILCYVKAMGALLSMLRTTTGCLVRREDKHWQGTSIVLTPPHNNHHIGASFDFPTVWVSSLWLYLLQTSYQSLFLNFFISLFLPCAYPLPDCVQVTVREFSCQRVLQLEVKVNRVDRWISYQYRLFWRTRPPPPPPLVVLWDQRCGIHPA